MVHGCCKKLPKIPPKDAIYLLLTYFVDIKKPIILKIFYDVKRRPFLVASLKWSLSMIFLVFFDMRVRASFSVAILISLNLSFSVAILISLNRIFGIFLLLIIIQSHIKLMTPKKSFGHLSWWPTSSNWFWFHWNKISKKQLRTSLE